MQRIVHNRPGALAQFALSGAEESATGRGSPPEGGGAGFRAASFSDPQPEKSDADIMAPTLLPAREPRASSDVLQDGRRR